MGVQPRVLLKRLAVFVDGFAGCFGRRKRQDAARRYVKGLLSDAKRKNMQCMWGRITDRGDYQALQHFITHSTWSSQLIWQRLRQKIPVRKGVLIVDDTGIPKRGEHSVGVQRQYSGTLGKVGNCQIVVSTVLKSRRCTWPIAMELYLPEKWANDESRRDAVGIPEHIRFRTKWEIALEQIDQAIESGIEVQCVAADSGYGDCVEFRNGLADRDLYYVVAIRSSDKAFDKPPRFISAKQRGKTGRPSSRVTLAKNSPKPKSVKQIADALSATKWRKITWRKASKGDMQGEFAALRVTPSHHWHRGKQQDECWLLCERCAGEDEKIKYYLSNLPRRTALKRLVDWARSRWAIEQSYEHMKDELAMDHFEGRSYPGFHHHLVLTAMAFTFLQMERRRSRSQELPTLNKIRWILTEIVTAQLFASEERLGRMILDFMHDPPEF